MKTKRIIFTAIACIFSVCLQANDSLSVAYKRIDKLEQSIKAERASLEKVQGTLERASVVIDSLSKEVQRNNENIKKTADEIGVKIDKTNTSLVSKADSSDVTSKTVWGIILFFVLAVLGGVIYYILHKRINKGTEDVEALKEKAEKLNEEILNKLSDDMDELQKLVTAINSVSGKQSEPDHSLIKTLADRITFMEMTLFKMDPKVKGYKQLSKSISQMKDNLLANGYELVDMLGKPYNDGMKAVANFNDDEEIEEGKRIITAIIKPQINYKGQMIQAAQITVSQNIK